MPQLFDSAAIRARMEHDRIWAAFSIADLDPPCASHATWFGPEHDRAVLLVYAAYDPPIVFCQGTPGECDLLLGEPDVVARTGSAYLNVLPHQLPAASRHFPTFESRTMVRMVLDADVPLHVASNVTPLGFDDLDAVQRLYADEPPGFFLPSQLRDGVYFGVWEDSELVAVAGTHVVSVTGSVAAIGNVHTRPDRRRGGLAAASTTAVAAELRRRGISTVVLNIVGTNEAARRVYERIGFREYCVFHEGRAWR